MRDDTWLMSVYQYAEREKGLDYIGAGDMLRDLVEFARERLRLQGQADPSAIWDEFTQSPAFAQYHPPVW